MDEAKRSPRFLCEALRAHPICRNPNRCTFPVAVFGKCSTISIHRGYFQTPTFCLHMRLQLLVQHVLIHAGCRPVSTTKAFGLISPCSSGCPTTAASSTAR